MPPKNQRDEVSKSPKSPSTLKSSRITESPVTAPFSWRSGIIADTSISEPSVGTSKTSDVTVVSYIGLLEGLEFALLGDGDTLALADGLGDIVMEGDGVIEDEGVTEGVGETLGLSLMHGLVIAKRPADSPDSTDLMCDNTFFCCLPISCWMFAPMSPSVHGRSGNLRPKAV